MNRSGALVTAVTRAPARQAAPRPTWSSGADRQPAGDRLCPGPEAELLVEAESPCRIVGVNAERSPLISGFLGRSDHPAECGPSQALAAILPPRADLTDVHVPDAGDSSVRDVLITKRVRRAPLAVQYQEGHAGPERAGPGAPGL